MLWSLVKNAHYRGLTYDSVFISLTGSDSSRYEVGQRRSLGKAAGSRNPPEVIGKRGFDPPDNMTVSKEDLPFDVFFMPLDKCAPFIVKQKEA